MKMKRLLNVSEERVKTELEAVVSPHSFHVYVKMRVADVCPIKKSGISRALYSYALKAHFDFVVADKNQSPEFAVEFDGPSHVHADT